MKTTISTHHLGRPASRLMAFAIALVLTVALGASPAGAATKTWHGHDYTLTSHWYVGGVGCLWVRVTGHVSVEHWSTPRDPQFGGGSDYDSYGPRVQEPKEQAWLTPGKCTLGPYTQPMPQASKLRMRQMYYGYPDCKPNWSLSASLPLGVGAGIAPSCSDAKLIERGTTYAHGSSFTQKNPGGVGTFQHTAGSTTGYPTLCARVATDLTVWHGKPHHRVSAEKVLSLGRICI